MFAPPQSLDLIGNPKREISTENGKRIDILLEGEDWVLIIENKIYHHQSNPFAEYEKFAENSYKGKEAIFVILSPGGGSVSSSWIALSYKTFIDNLKNNVGKIIIENQYSKWFVFLRDFILNIEQYAVRYDMDKKAINFIENNYQDVFELVKLRESYINYLQKAGLNKLKSLFPTQSFTTTIHNWGHGPAIRFYSESWIGKSNIVVQLSHRDSDRGIGIYIYAYKVPESEIASTDKKLQKDYHIKPWTESKTIRCYKSDNRFNNYDDVLQEFEETAKNFNEFNKNKKT